MNREIFQKGVIFDLDGTLIDSMGMWENLCERFLRAQGITPPPDLRDTLWTMDLDECARYLVATFPLPLTPEETISAIHEMIRNAYRDEIPAKPGALALLDALDRANIPVCLATATDRVIFSPALERLGIDKYFCFTRTCAEAQKSKRDPQIYLDCAEFLALPPQELVVVEDTLHAASTAKRAGFTVIGVRDPYSAQDWAGLSRLCDRFVDSLEALL